MAAYGEHRGPLAWVQRCPNPMPGPSEIEIRPLYEMDDLC